MVKNQKRNLFREAVKPTEVSGTATSEAEKDPKWVSARNAWEQHTGKKFNDMPTNQKISISRNVLKPAAQKGYLENPRTKERIPIEGSTAQPQAQQTSTPTPSVATPTQNTSPIVGRADPSTSQGQAAIATNQQQIQQNTQATQQAGANQSAASAASLQNLQGGGRTQPAQPSAPQQAQQPSTQEPLVTDDSGQSYTYDDIKSMIDNIKTQSVPASDEEMSEDEEVDLSKIQENKNIAYFLKCLSEKNYSDANKYMCKIVESKFKSKLKKVIK
jgi:hypothetical protein